MKNSMSLSEYAKTVAGSGVNSNTGENRDFVKSFQNLEAAIKAEQVNREVAYRQMTDAVSKITAAYEQLQGVDVPIINGAPVIQFALDPAKLNNVTYIAETIKVVEEQLSRIDTIGLKMIDDILRKQ